MFLKIFVPGAVAVIGGLYVTGTGLGADFSRDVAKPPQMVYDKLTGADLEQLARHTGFVNPPQIRRSGTGKEMTFQLVADKEIAMQMDVSLSPIQNGEGTRVIGNMTSYTLSEGKTLPAQYSEGAIESLIEMAMNDQLDQFEPGYDPAKARAARTQRNRELARARLMSDPIGFQQDAITQVNSRFEEAKKRFDEQDREREHAEATKGISFRPGKPMVDTDR